MHMKFLLTISTMIFQPSVSGNTLLPVPIPYYHESIGSNTGVGLLQLRDKDADGLGRAWAT